MDASEVRKSEADRQEQAEGQVRALRVRVRAEEPEEPRGQQPMPSEARAEPAHPRGTGRGQACEEAGTPRQAEGEDSLPHLWLYDCQAAYEETPREQQVQEA